MKILNRGWQYTVYDIGEGRVLKKYNTLLVACLMMLRESFIHFRLPVFGFRKYYQNTRANAFHSLKNVSESTLDKSMFGNPKIVSTHEYEQDHEEPLSTYLRRVDAVVGKETINRFIEFCTVLRSNSIIEKHFSIGNNFGINKKGKIILIDLGEICTEEEEIKNQIQKRVWANADVLSGLPSHLRKYFVERMDQTFLQK